MRAIGSSVWIAKRVVMPDPPIKPVRHAPVSISTNVFRVLPHPLHHPFHDLRATCLALTIIKIHSQIAQLNLELELKHKTPHTSIAQLVALAVAPCPTRRPLPWGGLNMILLTMILPRETTVAARTKMSLNL